MDPLYKSQKIRDEINALQNAEPMAAARRLPPLLARLESHPMQPQKLLEHLELLHVTIDNCCQALCQRYLSAKLPLRGDMRPLFDLRLEIFNLMAKGYRHALSERTRLDQALSDNQYSLACQRATMYLSLILLQCMQVYERTPSSLWITLHQLYADCEALGIAEIEVAPAMPDSTLRCSATREYKRALLMALSHPESLRMGQIQHIYTALGFWVDTVRLQSGFNREEIGELFGLNTQTDAPPSPLRFLHLGDAENIRSLNLRELLHAIAAKLTSLPAVDSPLMQASELTRNTLNCLQASLRMQSQRSAARATRNQPIAPAIGLQTIHHCLLPTQETTPKATGIKLYEEEIESWELMDRPSNQGGLIGVNRRRTIQKKPQMALSKPTGTAQKADTVVPQPALKTATDWMVINISSGGLGLRWSGQGATQALVGELFAIRDNRSSGNAEQWRIGVLRWMQFEPDGALRGGLQLLSIQVRAVLAEHKRSTKKGDISQRACLLLPEIQEMQQPASLLTPDHSYRSGDKLSFYIDGKIMHYKLGQLNEQTGSFSHFQIESFGVAKKKATFVSRPKNGESKKKNYRSPDSSWDII